MDTAGRLHLDEELMREVRAVVEAIEPGEILFVADSMTGQDAVRSAAGFAAALPLTGIILTKTDGDARGGAALSVVSTLEKPIKFVGRRREAGGLRALPSGPDGLPDPGARRRADADREGRGAGGRPTPRDKLAERSAAGEFTLEDLRDQLASMKKMGPALGPARPAPEGGRVPGSLRRPTPWTRGRSARVGAIIDSMTPEERRYPQLLNGSRKKRIARGLGNGGRRRSTGS